MHDNKVRLSQDVIQKAEQIANEWGLKNARAAVEAVFRKYCDDYLYGRMGTTHGSVPVAMASMASYHQTSPSRSHQTVPKASETGAEPASCEALEALDQLLAL